MKTKVLEGFDKYKKGYKVKSKPYDYIHEGLDNNQHYSNLIKDIKTTLTKHTEEVLKDLLPEEEDGNATESDSDSDEEDDKDGKEEKVFVDAQLRRAIDILKGVQIFRKRLSLPTAG